MQVIRLNSFITRQGFNKKRISFGIFCNTTAKQRKTSCILTSYMRARLCTETFLIQLLSTVSGHFGRITPRKKGPSKMALLFQSSLQKRVKVCVSKDIFGIAKE